MRSRRTSNEPGLTKLEVTRPEIINKGLTRREWTVIFGATPLVAHAAQTSTTPESTGAASLEKTLADVRKVSDRLSKLEVPMNVEPAFYFKA